MSPESRKDGDAVPSECINTDNNVVTSPAVLNTSSNAGPKRHYSIKSVHNLGLHDQKPTTYCDTFTHLVKANVGCGVLAMGMAFRNGGLMLSVILFTLLGLISCYNQYVLVNIANKVKYKNNFQTITLGETIGAVFDEGSAIFKKSADFARCSIKVFIIITQFGYCCVYFLFISQSLEQLCACYDIKVNLHVLMVHVLPVILVIALIRELKYISPLSTICNISSFIALSLILYNSVIGLGPISDRNFVGHWNEIPLSFGVMVFALEGITLTLPLEQNMQKREQFLGTFGVLNVSLMFALAVMQVIGFFGYYKFGEDVKESLTLNLEMKNNIVAQGVIALLILGILSSYALQFFVLVHLFLPSVKDRTAAWPYYSCHLYEYLLRSFLVLVTFLMAELIPHLDLVISLAGSIGGTAVSFLYVPLAEISQRKRDQYGVLSWRIIVAVTSIIVAVLGCLVGTVVSIKEIYFAIQADLSA